MKLLLLTLFLALISVSFAISQNARYAAADSIASLDYKTESVEELAALLSSSLETDEEKARSFFTWLAKNVRYDCRKFHNPVRPDINARTKEEYDQKLAAWREKQLARSLKNKRGVCEDYSRLFKAMCDYTGVEAVIITGNARNFHRPQRSGLGNSHAWNAVRIDGEWKLLDATWAAGHANAEVTKFTQNFKPGYFFPPSEWLMQTHYPKDEEWQLTGEPISTQEFADQPMVNFGQQKYKLDDFATKTEVGDGQKLIWFKFADEAPQHFGVATPSGKPVKFQHFERDGKTYIAISSTRLKRVNIFMRDSQRSRGDWLAMYLL